MPRRPIFRKSIVIPTEHGAWSWLLVPFFVGTAVAGALADGTNSLALLSSLLTLVGGLGAFLMRQPASVWLRIRRGRASRANEALAAGWTLGLASVAGLCLLSLLALGRTALLWLIVPFAVMLLVYLAAARIGRAGMRSLWTELAGAAGLALTAPAAVIAVNSHLNLRGWALWGLMALQNLLGVLYVRLRLADTHNRPANRTAVFWGHVVGLMGVVVAGLVGWVPLATAVPFAGFVIRTAWAARQPRPIANVRRFGFTEVGVEVLSGILLAASYWID